ncbi:hypothetical protein DFQ27_005975 [Actinomortierella ambigua]|uniref:Uncharacterized protein n=1 Tax=Actinomortierella ambigua TaxID=1343610 RepID=A0A9P6Q0L7_9FUNG|nr:hypothetical protein DFQ26_005825 [Actinomortierella ambigua]KAG0255976.1 hypothetical protein DFQ27_005975 [Actinomortierella ambigua]
MGHEHRRYCCFCVPLRFAVFIISIALLGIAAATSYQKYKANEASDDTVKIVIYVTAGVQAFVALVGLLAVITKSKPVTTFFSVLWWILTLAVAGLSIVNIVLLTTRDRGLGHDICRTALSENTPVPSEDDVETCYKWSVIISAIVIVVQFIVNAVCGWIILNYRREVNMATLRKKTFAASVHLHAHTSTTTTA